MPHTSISCPLCSVCNSLSIDSVSAIISINIGVNNWLEKEHSISALLVPAKNTFVILIFGIFYCQIHVVETDTINTYKNRFIKHWSNEEVVFNFSVDLTGILPQVRMSLWHCWTCLQRRLPSPIKMHWSCQSVWCFSKILKSFVVISPGLEPLICIAYALISCLFFMFISVPVKILDGKSVPKWPILCVCVCVCVCVLSLTLNLHSVNLVST